MMKRNVAMAAAVLMMAGAIAKAEGTPPTHGGPGIVRTAPAPLTEAQKQAKLFQLVSACLAERPGAPSAADDILKKFRGAGAGN